MSLPNELVDIVYMEEKQKRVNKTKRTLTTIEEVLTAVAGFQDIHAVAYTHKNRDPELVDGRKAYSQLVNKYIESSLTDTGKLINRTHDNMIYYNKCEYPEVKEIVSYIEDNYIFPPKKKQKPSKLTYDQKILIRSKLREINV